VNIEEVYFAKFKVKANNYIFARDLQIVKSADDVLINENCLVYGNAAFKNIPAEKIINISHPKPEYVAKWARQFYKEELRFDYDFLEPNYFKNFIVKEKSNV
jgi:hypothetical protein